MPHQQITKMLKKIHKEKSERFRNEKAVLNANLSEIFSLGGEHVF